MAQEKGTAERIRKKLPHVDHVFGTHALWRFRTPISVMTEPPHFLRPVRTHDRGRAPALGTTPCAHWLSFMYGCDNFCSYCIVPYGRAGAQPAPFRDLGTRAASPPTG
jgi:tRNA-2-methylthio-N6-dimethylallyladenosine synthase